MGDHRANRHPGHGHSHSHSHSSGDDAVELEVARLPRFVLLAVLTVVGVATIVAGVLLWPDAQKVDHLQGSVGFSAPGVTYPSADVDKVQPACPTDGAEADPATCGHVVVTVSGGASDGTKVTIDVPPEVSHAGLAPGSRLELIRTPGSHGQPATIAYFGIERGDALWWLLGLFVVVVVAVARLRGVMALLGLAISAVVLGVFVVPALLSGESPVPVAIAGSVFIMYVVLYSTHGLSIRTSAALAGTLGGIVVIAAVGLWAVSSAQLTGVADEGGGILTSFAGGLDFQQILVAGVLIAGLGVLNDVTITQASAVWELRGASPTLTRPRLFASAMRIGRDHIASTIYTIVFAYAGTALILLMIISLYDRTWFDLIGTEQIAEELVRAMTGSIGLVLAVPITTAISVLTVPGPAGPRPEPMTPGDQLSRR